MQKSDNLEKRVFTGAKKALITGVTGQDGWYLAELLLQKGYEVFGFLRHGSTKAIPPEVVRLEGNMVDLHSIRIAMEQARPSEVYNLASQSHVGLSFEKPDVAREINFYGLGRVVNEAVRVNPAVKVFQATSREIFGDTASAQNESTPFNPMSPYAESKMRAHEDFVVAYRKSRGIFVCSGILFNHESPRRESQYVTRKITRGLAAIKHGRIKPLELGNLETKRDWGFAGDYVKAMYLMLVQETPDDFVIATGVPHSVKDFINASAAALDMPLMWQGEGKDTQAHWQGQLVVRVNEAFYRPVEVNASFGNPTKAQHKLGWEASTSFEDLVAMMVKADYDALNI